MICFEIATQRNTEIVNFKKSLLGVTKEKAFDY